MSRCIRGLLFWRLCYAEAFEPLNSRPSTALGGDVFRRVQVGRVVQGQGDWTKARLIVAALIHLL